MATTPVKLHALCPLLEAYPQQAAARYLKDGFTFGFPIPFTGLRVAMDSGNLKSARERPDVVAAKIQKELAAGRIAGPFTAPPMPNLRVSPLGVVPKKTPGEYRLIHHLSYPRGSSVNDAIPPELCTVKYASFDHAVGLVRACGADALMAKSDIQSAFRLLPVHPNDFCLLGFKFNGAWYVDKAMPMGCAVACAAFEAFSTFLEWATKVRANTSHVTHYLDDFLFVGPSNSPACGEHLTAFQTLADELGVPLAQDKTEGPTTRLCYLGIQLDSVAGTSSLPDDKLLALQALITMMRARAKCTLKELQSLVGHLNFACRVVTPGRAFCARLARALAGANAPHHRIRVTKGMKEDLKVWLEFLANYNGVSVWQRPLVLEGSMQIHSDAAGTCGFGVYFNGRWCASKWPEHWAGTGIERDLTFLELFPILVAAVIWEAEFRNRRVVFWCDNQAVVRVVNKQTSRSERVMRLVRKLVLVCLLSNITFSARHVAGINNCIADALSRFQEERFRSLAPEANRYPDAFPHELWELGNLS